MRNVMRVYGLLVLSLVVFAASQVGMYVAAFVIGNASLMVALASVSALGLIGIISQIRVHVEMRKPQTPVVDYGALNAYYRSRLYRYGHGQYVYLIREAAPGGLFKIGRTSSPAKRLAGFDASLPCEIEIVSIISCRDMSSLERYFHERFSKQRVAGEWFSLQPSDVDVIRIFENCDV